MGRNRSTHADGMWIQMAPLRDGNFAYFGGNHVADFGAQHRVCACESRQAKPTRKGLTELELWLAKQ
jgi:hypothetical protein